MKKFVFLVLLAGLAGFLTAQEKSSEEPRMPTATFAPNFIGPIFGFYAGDFNFRVSEKLTLDSEIGYFNIKTIPLIGSAIPESQEFWYGNLKIGPTLYLNKSFHGLFVGGYGKISYFLVGSDTDNFNAMSIGGGAKAGWRWVWDWFSMAIGAGYEFNKAFAEVKSSDANISAQLASVEGGFPYFLFKMEFAVY